MAQVIDRRTDVGSRPPYLVSQNGKATASSQDGQKAASSSMSSQDHGRSLLGSYSNGKTTSSSVDSDAHSRGSIGSQKKANGRWALLNAGGEDSALARAQQFILETRKNPLQFEISDKAVAAPVPYQAINDGQYLVRRKADKEAKREALRKKQAEMKGHADAFSSSQSRKEQANGPYEQGNAEAGPSSQPSSATTSPKKRKGDLFPGQISLRPPKSTRDKGAGLANRGNTCYMNSTLQALLHLPPLSYALLALDDGELYGRLGGPPNGNRFDALGEMAKLANRTMPSDKADVPSTPGAFIKNLRAYARTLSPGRQEDAHEFLRFVLEAMQYCCISRAPSLQKKADPLRETSLIHKIFGGRLRSRVHCTRCGHNSDTFDPILDLSLDIRGLRSPTLAAALANFTNEDVLSGANKYKCEKCNRAVEATKRFTIHEPPAVLTIHLKRFTATGQKISKQIDYTDELVLNKSVLSEGQAPLRYRLHAIVLHHGGGPNSGHYVANVRGLKTGNRWYEMNDSSVQSIRGAPLNHSNAYILFYARVPGDALNGILQGGSPSHMLMDAAGENSRKRRRVVDDDESAESGKTSFDSLVATGLDTPRKAAEKIQRPNDKNSYRSANQSGSSTPELYAPQTSWDGPGDDLGKAIGSQRAMPSSPYESLTGNGKADRPKKRKLGLGSSPLASRAPSTAMSSPVQRIERGMNSLVTSPYTLQGKNTMNSKDFNQNRLMARHGQNGKGHARSLLRLSNGHTQKVGSRMKNRNGE